MQATKTSAIATADVHLTAAGLPTYSELLEIAGWAEPALSYLVLKATTKEDRPEFERRRDITHAAIARAA
jgi:hypothetical protein